MSASAAAAQMSYHKIVAKLEIYVMMWYQAMLHIKHHGTINNIARKTRPRKSDIRTDHKIYQPPKSERFKTAVDIHAEISSDFDKNSISLRT